MSKQIQSFSNLLNASQLVESRFKNSIDSRAKQALNHSEPLPKELDQRTWCAVRTAVCPLCQLSESAH